MSSAVLNAPDELDRPECKNCYGTGTILYDVVPPPRCSNPDSPDFSDPGGVEPCEPGHCQADRGRSYHEERVCDECGGTGWAR